MTADATTPEEKKINNGKREKKRHEKQQQRGDGNEGGRFRFLSLFFISDGRRAKRHPEKNLRAAFFKREKNYDKKQSSELEIYVSLEKIRRE